MKSIGKDLFSSRWAFILAAMGMAVGAGNIWRFPRLAGQYGGSFLIPWVIFLFVWSIPLIVIEFSLGKTTRKGVIGAFVEVLGKRFAWMGWFIGMCTIGIMFYYSVVCGWGLKYFWVAISQDIHTLDHQGLWNSFTTGNPQSLIFLAVSILFTGWIISRGISGGIEKATKIMIPLLFVLLIVAAIRAITLPGAEKGLEYFFRVRAEDLFDYKVWLEALSQSAWSTGAGWGLILTYSTYVKKDEPVISNSIMTGIGNNIASVLAGLAVIPTVFALSASPFEAVKALQAGNQGLTFIYIPQLFASMDGGKLFTAIFFLVLFIAAISSLLSMLELAVKLLGDYGIKRKLAVMITVGVTFVAGIPSALSLKFFNNQDWVWGVGLLLSGLFFIILVLKYGIFRFRDKFLMIRGESKQNDIILRALAFVMPIEFAFMFGWWFLQSVQWYPENWWDPFQEFTIGTCLLQWALLIAAGLLLNTKLAHIKTE